MLMTFSLLRLFRRKPAPPPDPPTPDGLRLPTQSQLADIHATVRGLVESLTGVPPDARDPVAEVLAPALASALVTLTCIANSMGDDPKRYLFPYKLTLSVAPDAVRVLTSSHRGRVRGS